MSNRSSILNVANQAPVIIQYLRSLDASLLWTPSRTSKDGIDWTGNNTPSAQNVSDLTLGTGPYPPIIGGAPVLEFGGTNGYVSLPDPTDIDPEVTGATLLVAVNPNSLTNYQVYFGAGYLAAANGYGLYAASTLYGFQVRNSGTLASATWNHGGSLDPVVLVGTRDTSDNTRLFVNGTLQHTTNQSLATSRPTLPWAIGTRAEVETDNRFYADALISLAAMHSRALSAGEIQAATELILRGA